MAANWKDNLIKGVLVLVICWLLFDKCNKPVVEPQGEKETPERIVYTPGKDSVVYDTIVRWKENKRPQADSIFASMIEEWEEVDTLVRHYPLSENDSTGGTLVSLYVRGQLLSSEITRTCFNTTTTRVDTLEQHYRAKYSPRRMLSMGGFSGVIGTQFTFGVAAYYTDKRRMSVGVLVDPINRGGVGVVTVPIGLRK